MKQRKEIKICEVFESLQGEGRFAGVPMLFIRTSGCTRSCWFCDTKYHEQGRFTTIDSLIKKINKSKLDIVCWTGGEPLVWADAIYLIIKKTKSKKHHIETNGDLLMKEDFYYFDYLAISPKDLTFKKLIPHAIMLTMKSWDIKVVTDLKTTGKELIPYATMLMPLTTRSKKENLETMKRVWQYCVKKNLKFSPRLHNFIWGRKKKI